MRSSQAFFSTDFWTGGFVEIFFIGFLLWIVLLHFLFFSWSLKGFSKISATHGSTCGIYNYELYFGDKSTFAVCLPLVFGQISTAICLKFTKLTLSFVLEFEVFLSEVEKTA